MAASRRKKPAPPRDPPTVSRVRAVRAKMWKDAGGTIEGLIALARKEAAGYGLRPSAGRQSRTAA